jgi:hypothetical protein
MKVITLTHAKLTDTEGNPKKFSFIMGPGISFMSLDSAPGTTAIETVHGAITVLESIETIKTLLEGVN